MRRKFCQIYEAESVLSVFLKMQNISLLKILVTLYSDKRVQIILAIKPVFVPPQTQHLFKRDVILNHEFKNVYNQL